MLQSAKEAKLEALTTLAFKLGQSRLNGIPYYSVTRLIKLARIAANLHRRYEAAFCYQWANTERYEEQTERLEGRARKLADELQLNIEFNHDPRGWPIKVLTKDGHEIVRLG